MRHLPDRAHPADRNRTAPLLVLLVVAWGFLATATPVPAQDAAPDDAIATDAGPNAEPAADAPDVDPMKLADEALAAEEPPPEDDAEAALDVEPTEKVRLLELLVKGGALMLPIAAMSLLVVTFGMERFLALRRRKVLPPELIEELGILAGRKGGLDPEAAYEICRQHPSTAAAVIRAMLLKVGRPHTELEHTVSEASDREAARLYSNVRWLSLAAGITPLLGLLGTVWGMINAFFVTANLPVGANKAQHLADGIYVALVTTFAGLAVAIPAAVLAHVFEGRIQSLFRELDEILLGLLPQLERLEGRPRAAQNQLDQSNTQQQSPQDESQPDTPLNAP